MNACSCFDVVCGVWGVGAMTTLTEPPRWYSRDRVKCVLMWEFVVRLVVWVVHHFFEISHKTCRTGLASTILILTLRWVVHGNLPATVDVSLQMNKKEPEALCAALNV